MVLKQFSGLLILGGCLALYDLFGRDLYFAYINAQRVPTLYDNIVGYFIAILIGFFITSRLNRRLP